MNITKSGKLIIFFLFLCSNANVSWAESDGRMRRFNEGQNIDLKMRQQGILRQQQNFSNKQQLEKLFQQQQLQQRQLQLRQRRQLPAAVPPAAPSRQTAVQPTDNGRQSIRQRFKREQRGRELNFKMQQESQLSSQIEDLKEELPTDIRERLQKPFDDRLPLSQ
jgi:sRNA-binding protein